jgi:hypothetical protein
MSIQSVPRLSFDSPLGAINVEPSSAPLSTDAGLLPIRQFDERIRHTEQFAAALEDRRDLSFTEHSHLSMVRQRIYGIMADNEDQNDYDTLRSDPIFKLMSDSCQATPTSPANPLVVRERRLDPRPVAAA